jgi:hypothetical protein
MMMIPKMGQTEEILIGNLVELLGQGISPIQGFYLLRTTQHRKMQAHIHTPSGIPTCNPSV